MSNQKTPNIKNTMLKGTPPRPDHVTHFKRKLKKLFFLVVDVCRA